MKKTDLGGGRGSGLGSAQGEPAAELEKGEARGLGAVGQKQNGTPSSREVWARMRPGTGPGVGCRRRKELWVLGWEGRLRRM